MERKEKKSPLLAQNTPQVKTDQQAIIALPNDINSKITIPPQLTGVVYVW